MRSGRAAQDGPGQREGMAGIGRTLAASGEGQRAREAERVRLGLQHGPQLGR